MDGTADIVARWSGSLGSVQGDAGLAFAAFILRHAGCVGETIESRLGEDLVACWYPQCNETRTFGTVASRT
jgi:hypothetical protein